MKTSETLTGLQFHSDWIGQINMEYKPVPIGLLPVIGWQIVPKFPRTPKTLCITNQYLSVLPGYLTPRVRTQLQPCVLVGPRAVSAH